MLTEQFYFDELNILECKFTALGCMEILKCCIIKKLKICHISIYFKQICDSILAEASKILNFKNSVPLLISINETKVLFIVNCALNDLALEDCDFANSHLYFSNITLNERNVESLLNIRKRNKLHINIFEMNLTDEIMNVVLAELEPLQDKTYLLTSSTRLIAYNCKRQQNITEAIADNTSITTLQLINCELLLDKKDLLGNYLFNTSRNWELIDLSGCNIGDKGFFNLSHCLSDNKNKIHIQILNLSSNNLTSRSVEAVLKILQHHVIKALIISGNRMSCDTLNETLEEHFLEFLNFTYNISLIVYQRLNDMHHSLYETCNVYAFEASDMVAFQSQTCYDDVLRNISHFSTNKCNVNVYLYLLHASSPTAGSGCVINEHIIKELVTLKHDRKIKFEFSEVNVTHKSLKILFSCSFSDNCIEELDLSSHKISSACISKIVESLQYCIMRRLILSDNRLDTLEYISATILKYFHARENVYNFIEKPLTVIIKTQTDTSHYLGVNTYLRNYQVTEETIQGLLINNQAPLSHTFVLLDCLSTSDLSSILSIMNNAPFIVICIFETRITNDSLLPHIEHLEAYDTRIQYVLAGGIKFVACNAQQFHIVPALNSKLIVCDIELVCCFISKDGLQAIASCLCSRFKTLKSIKVTKCKVNDDDFYDFCEKLYSTSSDLEMSICLKTVDLSHNELTSSCVDSILKFLQCSVIENMILSDNSINNDKLMDAIFKLACNDGDKIQNLNLGVPTVIVNTQTLQLGSSSNNMVQLSAGIILINCEIDKAINSVLRLSSQIKKLYFMDSIVVTKNLQMIPSMLQDALHDSTQVIYYERYLEDEVAQKVETYLTKEFKFDVSYILASDKTLRSNNSTYHQIASLIDSNLFINVLHLTNFRMQFPNNGQFIRSLSNITRNWDMIDLSGCNIRDDGCLQLQKCLVASKCTINDLNVKYNNLSSVSAAAIANIILQCSVTKVDISHNKLQDAQVNDALKCLKRNSTNSICTEIITNNSTTIVLSNASPRLSSVRKAQLSLICYDQFTDFDTILSSFKQDHLSQVIFQNNGLTLEQVNTITKVLPSTDIHIEEPHMHYTHNLLDFPLLQIDLEEIISANNTKSAFSSLIFSKINAIKNKLSLHDIKTLDSLEVILTNFIEIMHPQVYTISISNCFITKDMAEKLTIIIQKSTDLQLFELHYNYIQESDLKKIVAGLKSKSLNCFAIKSISCFNEDTIECIANVIANNLGIKCLEISNCAITQPTKIAKSIKGKGLKQLNLSNNIFMETEVHDTFSSGSLEQLNLSQCKLQEFNIIKIISTLKNSKTRLTRINLSGNSITNKAADALASLLGSVVNLELSDCYLQENGLLQIINALKSESLKSLNLSRNIITDLVATDLSTGISNYPSITDLNLLNCNIQEGGIKEILTSLKDHVSSLKLFRISCSFSSKEVVKLFQSVLETNRSIKCLTLQDCNCEEIFHPLMKKLPFLQELDIASSKLSNHNLIAIVASNVNLRYLNISNCDLQGDIVQDGFYNILFGLYLDHLNLGGIKITKEFARFLDLVFKRAALKHLDLSNCEMEENEMICITDSLTSLTSLCYLNCSNNAISGAVAHNMAKVISNNTYLKHLDISFCCSTEETFLPIVNALQQVKGLKFLNISGNLMRESTLTECQNKSSPASVLLSQFTEVITHNCFLECLDICDCNLSDQQMAKVATALETTSTIKHLNLSHNEIITDNAANKVALVITNNSSLQNINLSTCGLQENGIILLTNALAKLTSLVSIDISNNGISDGSIRSIATCVKNNVLLEQLNLSCCFQYGANLECGSNKNEIEDILMSLVTSVCLRTVNLHSCYINDEPSVLPAVISSNKFLSHLNLTDCKLHNATLLSIAKSLQLLATLKCLILSSNFVSDESAHEIASAVTKNFSLHHLAMSDCELEEDGLIDIATALNNISSIKHLDLSYNLITDSAAEVLASGIANNAHLKYLDLSFCTWQNTGFARIHQVLCRLTMIKKIDIRSH